MKITVLAVLVSCGLLAGCNTAPPNQITLDSGIGATGSAGTRGGFAAPPASAGAVATTPTR